MGGRVAVLVMGVCFALVLQSAHTATHIVGGSSNWTIPVGNAQLYTGWAANNTFNVGDELVFNFNTGEHDVMQVMKANYDSCGKTSPLATYTTPPVKITLNSTGPHYYICSFGTHCTSGQKITITVAGSASSPRSSPSPSPSTSTSPPPSESASPSSPTAGTPSTPSAASPGEDGGSSSGNGSPTSPPTSPSDNSASRLTASLGIFSGVAALFLL